MCCKPQARLLYLAVFLLLLNACAKRRVTTLFIMPEEVKELTAKGAIVLDVRTPAEFTSGHIHGARNLSIDSADFHSAVQALDKKARYIVHCSANVPKGRTDRAIEQLRAAGLENLSSMTGGIVAWQAKGLPVEKP